jgi:hypothetical protein
MIKNGYKEDPFCKKLKDTKDGVKGLTFEDSLWFVGGRLVIPRVGDLRETLFRLSHDSLGHFGFEKSYGSLRSSYYWPNMR